MAGSPLWPGSQAAYDRPMGMVVVTPDRVAEAADTLARGMVDEPSGRWLVPEAQEFLVTFRQVYAHLILLAREEGRVDAWGDPLVGIAIWLRRAALGNVASHHTAETARQPTGFPVHAMGRVESYAAVIRQLRERVRPDEHAYLDTIVVLPAHRGHGIATRLLEVGHAWADELRLPCALETATSRNVAFYRHRGYEVEADSPVPDSDLRITAMRRSVLR
jgi:GNAT superfamily N-acetyltransferase